MVEPGTVYNQNPAANQVEPKGTLIQIFVQPQNATPTQTPTDTTTPTTPPTTPTPTDSGTPTVTPTTGNGTGGGLGGLSTQAPVSSP
jgi:hypothetical protein